MAPIHRLCTSCQPKQRRKPSQLQASSYQGQKQIRCWLWDLREVSPMVAQHHSQASMPKILLTIQYSGLIFTCCGFSWSHLHPYRPELMIHSFPPLQHVGLTSLFSQITHSKNACLHAIPWSYWGNRLYQAHLCIPIRTWISENTSECLFTVVLEE